MATLFEELEICAVCFLCFNEKENRPKLLPCSHTVCVSCIAEIKSSKGGSSTSTNDATAFKKSSCPFCRKEFESSVVSDNRYILSYLSFMRSKRERPRASAPTREQLYGSVGAGGSKEGGESARGSDDEVAESKMNEVGINLNVLETRIASLSSSLDAMENIFQNMFKHVKEVLLTFNGVQASIGNLMTQFKSLKECYDQISRLSDGQKKSSVKLLENIDSSCDWLTKFSEEVASTLETDEVSRGCFSFSVPLESNVFVSVNDEGRKSEVVLLTENKTKESAI